MKKIFIIPTLIFFFSNNAFENTISACNSELQTNEYEPYLILSEKYKTAGKCLEDEILSRAKAIFLPEQYADFEKSFKQLSSAYLQVATDINENNKNVFPYAGTLDKLQTQYQWYNSLLSIKKMIDEKNFCYSMYNYAYTKYSICQNLPQYRH